MTSFLRNFRCFEYRVLKMWFNDGFRCRKAASTDANRRTAYLLTLY